MAQAISESEEALRVAQAMSSDFGEVKEWEDSRSSGYSFKYEGAVHAHLIEDGWKLIGFGSGWFAIRSER